jgi:serine/threonine-protein kinase ATR
MYSLYAVKQFGTALQHGTKYIYQTMPRMLTLWLELGTVVTPGDQRSTPAKEQVFFTMNKKMKKWAQDLPSFQFLTALSAMLSQITHKNVEVYNVLERIIVNIVTNYPQQALWQLVPISKSTHPQRSRRGEQILNKAKVGFDLKAKLCLIEFEANSGPTFQVEPGGRLLAVGLDKQIEVCDAGFFP